MNKFKLVIIALGTSTFSLFSQVTEPDLEVKEKIVEHLYGLNEVVTQSSIEKLLLDLEAISYDTSMCFISLGEYNNCETGKSEVYPRLMKYIDDLVGKDVKVELTRWNKPWDDENFYTLRFKLSYSNENESYPVDINFDTIILDINEDKIKTIIYAREWVDLASFGE